MSLNCWLGKKHAIYMHGRDTTHPKSNEFLSLAAKQVQLENIMFGEINQSQK